MMNSTSLRNATVQDHMRRTSLHISVQMQGPLKITYLAPRPADYVGMLDISLYHLLTSSP